MARQNNKHVKTTMEYLLKLSMKLVHNCDNDWDNDCDGDKHCNVNGDNRDNDWDGNNTNNNTTKNTLSKRKISEFIQLAHKHQIRLGKTKNLLCWKCHSLLIPKVSCEARMEKKENGFGIFTKCFGCGGERFVVLRSC